jgi:hypothetical protein
MPAARSRRTACSDAATSWVRCIHASAAAPNDCTPNETRLIPAATHLSTTPAVTSSGLASRVISISSADPAPSASHRYRSSSPSCAAGSNDGVPPPRYSVSRGAASHGSRARRVSYSRSTARR